MTFLKHLTNFAPKKLRFPKKGIIAGYKKKKNLEITQLCRIIHQRYFGHPVKSLWEKLKTLIFFSEF